MADSRTSAGDSGLLPSTLLRIEQVSARTGVPEATLRYWRWKGIGPTSFKIGRRVVYDLAVVEAWLDTQRRGGAAAG